MNYEKKCFALHRRFNDDGYATRTTIEQMRVEKSIEHRYDVYFENDSDDDESVLKIILFRAEHIEYLKNGLFKPLDHHFYVLDTSRSWMVYWISLSLNLLGESDYLKKSLQIISFLRNCESPHGGYGGGPNQEPHLAATYAAVNAIVTIGNDIAFNSLNRVAIEKFLRRMQQPNGSFTLHESGEVDIRGAYCALSVAKLLHIPTYPESDLFHGTADWILSCQTYEGGFGAAPGHEAHGGYTFCGVAALALLDQLDRCDFDALMHWTANRQLSFEGGFSGRTNKLVDGCYSFWNGAVLPILQSWRVGKNQMVSLDRWLFDQEALQEYVLICCQNHPGGGLVDKPGKNRDFYHTCYTLSGLSIAQNSFNSRIVIGVSDNLVEPIHPVFNIPCQSLEALREYLKRKDNQEELK
ncbi:farnesyl transferase beta subunit isoform X2 [Dermatophagoides farinae]|uniref:farnesyl transferase beta subunit isoform X2 n=1 Tax=Dermatophagoides farinae TaxID=6954 RepID=UPI003F5EB54B